MMPTTTKRVFISFTKRDKRDVALADFFAKALKARGAEPFKAPEGIPPGEKWEPGLADEIAKSTHFLVILSAAAIASEEVLKEVRQAHKRRAEDDDFGILPLVTGNLPEFKESEFLNDFQWVPYGDNATMLEAVCQAIGLRPRARLADTTAAIINDKTRDFIGRAYVFESIDRFLANNRSGYFTITADPGMGKSTVLAEFVRRTGVLAYFNQRQTGVNSTHRFLEDICTQLIGFTGLNYSALPPEATRDSGFLVELLREAVDKVQGRIVIAIDALDEVDLTGHPEGANILFLPRILPEGVYFILTMRPMVSLPLLADAARDELDLVQHPDENKADIEAYLESAAARPRIQAWIELRKTSARNFVHTLAKRSQSNFMYVVHVLFDIEQGKYDALRLDRLPKGLKGYYQDHWARMGMEARPAPIARIRIVGVLCVARQPISRKLISQFASSPDLKVDERTVQAVLDDWKQFLHESRGAFGVTYSIYHASFLDFLFYKVKDDPDLPSVEDLKRFLRDTQKQSLFGP